MQHASQARDASHIINKKDIEYILSRAQGIYNVYSYTSILMRARKAEECFEGKLNPEL